MALSKEEKGRTELGYEISIVGFYDVPMLILSATFSDQLYSDTYSQVIAGKGVNECNMHVQGVRYHMHCRGRKRRSDLSYI
jgi:hypothetical protein